MAYPLLNLFDASLIGIVSRNQSENRAKMQLVEQIVIKPNSPIFAEIAAAAFASKNLYNAANYVIRFGSDKARSHRLTRITDKRNRRVGQYLHTASKRIVDMLVAERIGVLVVGRNPDWKQSVNIGKRNNQNFVQI